MKDLEPYEKVFDEEYMEYGDQKYEAIKAMVEIYKNPATKSLLESEEFANCEKLIQPLVAIKNYKSQVPFPGNLTEALKIISEIAQLDHSEHELNEESKAYRLLSRLLKKEVEGVQLPTASALFHFCHSNSFPIVDRNVEAACRLLKDQYPDKFTEVSEPILPAKSTSIANKIAKYQVFIEFLERLKYLQSHIRDRDISFRELDKALMVYGVERLRKKVEGDEQLP